MMIVYPGDLRVFHLSRRSEVFVPASHEEVACFDRAYCRELPNRIVPTIEILEEAFPRVAAAYRRAGLAYATARIGLVLDDYDDDLDCFLQAYEASLTDREAAPA